MRLVITKDYVDMADWGARYIKKRINDFKPGPGRYFVLGLPTGRIDRLNISERLRSFFSDEFSQVVHR